MARPSTIPAAVPDVPNGYELRLYRPGDEAAYRDLYNLAFPGDYLEHTLAHAVPRGFFVVEHTASGHLVASCVAEHRSWDGGHRWGALDWLIGDPSHAGLGLGTAVSAKVTNRLVEEGYSTPGLETEDFRLAAINIYLKLGWRPYLYLDDMESRWRTTYERLGRPFLREQCLDP